MTFAGPGTGYCSLGLWYRVNEEKAESLSIHYIQRMACICDRLTSLYEVTLVFVPICTTKGDDDRECMNRGPKTDVFSRQRNIYRRWYSALREHGAYRCMRFIHRNEVSHRHTVSNHGSPTGSLGRHWLTRIPGIMKMLGLDNCVCNIVTAEESHIMSAISGAWNNRQEMRRIIRSKVSEVRKKH